MGVTGRDADIVVVGAGIVGLAAARAVQARLPGAEVLVVDKESGPATHQSGRNSGVLHSGLYYRPGSDKARLVSRGRRMMAERCADWGVRLDRCGKVVVATRTSELERLAALERRGRANGVELRRLSPAGLCGVEPAAVGLAALQVPDAAVVDFPAVCRALAGELAAAGGALRTGFAVEGVHTTPGGGLELRGPGGSLRAGWLVNCAGLHSDRVAAMAGAASGVHVVPFRGEYHELRPSARELVRGMIYPVPDPRWPFLGVHLTTAVDGSVHVGPNALLALGREAYTGGVQARDVADLVTDPGLRRLARRYWRTGAAEILRSRSRRLLVADVRRLVPAVGADDLVPAPAGIRAQAVARDGTLVDDFAFARSERAVHVLNAPSPAATASLAIGEVVAERLADAIG